MPPATMTRNVLMKIIKPMRSCSGISTSRSSILATSPQGVPGTGRVAA